MRPLTYALFTQGKICVETNHIPESEQQGWNVFLLFYTSGTAVQVSIVIHEMRTAAIHSLTLPLKLKISTRISS